MKLLKILNQYYISTRCVNAFASGSAKRYFTKLQAEQAIEFAEAILKWEKLPLKRKLKEEAFKNRRIYKSGCLLNQNLSCFMVHMQNMQKMILLSIAI